MLPMVCNEKKAKADKVSENDCNYNTHIRVRCPVGVSRGLCHSLDAEPFFFFWLRPPCRMRTHRRGLLTAPEGRLSADTPASGNYREVPGRGGVKSCRQDQSGDPEPTSTGIANVT